MRRPSSRLLVPECKLQSSRSVINRPLGREVTNCYTESDVTSEILAAFVNFRTKVTATAAVTLVALSLTAPFLLTL
jgi:hypothetical protein